jgi:hypothetical protein
MGENIALENEIVFKDGSYIRFNKLNTFELKICSDSDNSNCISDTLQIDYQYYQSYEGDITNPGSGAYLFIPYPETKFQYSNFTSGKLYKGNLITLITVKLF